VLDIAIAMLDRNVEKTLPRCDHAIVIGQVRGAGVPEWLFAPTERGNNRPQHHLRVRCARSR
jgi:hypothetical protein